MPFRLGRQPKPLGLPTSMRQCAAIRRLALHVPRKLYLGRRKTSLECNLLAFFFVAQRNDRHVVPKRLPTPLMHDPNSSADLGVLKRRDVLLQEVDEPALALQKRKKRERGRDIRLLWFFLGTRLWRSRFFRLGRRRQDGLGLSGITHTQRESLIHKKPEKTGPSKPEPREKRKGAFGHAPSLTRQAQSWEFPANAKPTYTKSYRSARVEDRPRLSNAKRLLASTQTRSQKP